MNPFGWRETLCMKTSVFGALAFLSLFTVLYKATNLRNRSLDTSNEVTKCMRANAWSYYYKGKKTINTCFYFIIHASCAYFARCVCSLLVPKLCD